MIDIELSNNAVRNTLNEGSDLPQCDDHDIIMTKKEKKATTEYIHYTDDSTNLDSMLCSFIMILYNCLHTMMQSYTNETNQ